MKFAPNNENLYICSMTKEEIMSWFVNHKDNLNFSSIAKEIGMKPQNFHTAILQKRHPVSGNLMAPLKDKYLPGLEAVINRLTTV